MDSGHRQHEKMCVDVGTSPAAEVTAVPHEATLPQPRATAQGRSDILAPQAHAHGCTLTASTSLTLSAVGVGSSGSAPARAAGGPLSTVTAGWWWCAASCEPPPCLCLRCTVTDGATSTAPLPRRCASDVRSPTSSILVYHHVCSKDRPVGFVCGLCTTLGHARQRVISHTRHTKSAR